LDLRGWGRRKAKAICVLAALVLLGSFGAPARAASTVHPFEGAPEDQALVDQVLSGWFPTTPPTNVVYVAPPDGTSVGTGSASDPRRDLIAVVAEATAGTAIYLAPGIYPMSQIRDQFGHPSSVIRTRASGTRGNPIIVTTDPALYDPAAGQVAVLDFDYENQHPGVRTMSFDISHGFWLVEQLELRKMDGRGIWLRGHDNVIRNNYLHHVDTTGTNNQGLILIIASGGPTNNVIAGNHFSHVGVLDRASGALQDPGGVNVGCIYTETRQTYDSVPPNVLPADSHAYIYNNYAHHCAYGYATKNQGEGPYFFLSNVAHDVRTGVRNTFSKSVIRNNIVFAGAGDVGLGSGISNGGAASSSFWSRFYNGHESEISHNTVVGAKRGIWYYSGWSVRSHHNLILSVDEGLHVHRNQYPWYNDGAWPGIRGEWLLGDLGPAHPYFAQMPADLQAKAGVFLKFSSVENCYDAEPVIAAADFVQPENDVTGMIADENHQIIPQAAITDLFVDTQSYVRDFESGAYATCGSRVSVAGNRPPPIDPPEGGAGGAAGSGGGSAATHGSEADPAGEEAGCGCRTAGESAPLRAGVVALAALALLWLRRRR
jgi:MYXO-CTERM domain-containing protein